MLKQITAEIHPSTSARIFRAMRWLDRFRGWRRVARITPSEALFTVVNGSTVYSGTLASRLDREVYLFGGYEDDLTEAFLNFIPPEKRGIALDIGANAGTHSLAFSRRFAEVHAFEPNERLWRTFERNVALNDLKNVHLHRVGLAEHAADLPFFDIGKDNLGLGTFSTVEQYDRPLQQVGVFRVERGDDFLEAKGISTVDAIKIDIQGFEPHALRGLNRTLAKSRPIVWIEIGDGTLEEDLSSLQDVQKLFPYPIKMHLMAGAGGVVRRIKTELVAGPQLRPGNYLISPAD
ncbi:FkbM family methyltransferase [Mesorhizobium sp. M1163]|uniref:FkbM family methyltransferase n=1 Tax=Mesorhizobium sp. M1163 TaxID=2957065 RepID=UPI003337B657